MCLEVPVSTGIFCFNFIVYENPYPVVVVCLRRC